MSYSFKRSAAVTKTRPRESQDLETLEYRSSIGPRTASKRSSSLTRRRSGSHGDLSKVTNFQIHSEMNFSVVPIGISSVHAQTAAKSFVESTEREKKEMQGLNDRLASYLDQVHGLEHENRQLVLDLEELRSQWGKDTAQTKVKFDAQLQAARKRLDDTTRHKVDEEVRWLRLQEDMINDARLCFDDIQNVRKGDKDRITEYREQLDDCNLEMDFLRQRVRQLDQEVKRYTTENSGLRQDWQKTNTTLDDEIISRIDHENQTQTLVEEFEFLRRLHDTEINELQALISKEPVDTREFFKNELAMAIKDIRDEYEAIAKATRADLESWYKWKIQEIETSTRTQTVQTTYQRDEIKRLRDAIADLRAKLALLDGRNGLLEKQLQELTFQLSDDQRQYEMALNDRDVQLRKAREECQSLVREMQALLDTKQMLDAEIAIYRKMLDTEETRTSRKKETGGQQSSSQPQTTLSHRRSDMGHDRDSAADPTLPHRRSDHDVSRDRDTKTEPTLSHRRSDVGRDRDTKADPTLSHRRSDVGRDRDTTAEPTLSHRRSDHDVSRDRDTTAEPTLSHRRSDVGRDRDMKAEPTLSHRRSDVGRERDTTAEPTLSHRRSDVGRDSDTTAEPTLSPRTSDVGRDRDATAEPTLSHRRSDVGRDRDATAEPTLSHQRSDMGHGQDTPTEPTLSHQKSDMGHDQVTTTREPTLSHRKSDVGQGHDSTVEPQPPLRHHERSNASPKHDTVQEPQPLHRSHDKSHTTPEQKAPSQHQERSADATGKQDMVLEPQAPQRRQERSDASPKHEASPEQKSSAQPHGKSDVVARGDVASGPQAQKVQVTYEEVHVKVIPPPPQGDKSTQPLKQQQQPQQPQQQDQQHQQHPQHEPSLPRRPVDPPEEQFRTTEEVTLTRTVQEMSVLKMTPSGTSKQPQQSDSVLPQDVAPSKPMRPPSPEYFGTVYPADNFDPNRDAEVLRKAVSKTLGADDKTIVSTLCNRSNMQRQQIKIAYGKNYQKDLPKDLSDKLRGDVKTLVSAIMYSPTEFDACELRKAMKGSNTDETILIEILTPKSSGEVFAIRDCYRRMYNRELEKDLANETTGKNRRLLVSLAAGFREEDDSGTDLFKARKDAEFLSKCDPQEFTTYDSPFTNIFTKDSFAQLQLVCKEYKKQSGNQELDEVIESELEGDGKPLAALVRCIRNTPNFFAERLHKSMKGFGTDDGLLVRTVVARSEVDMVLIKREFERMYRDTVENWIADDTSGSYKQGLLTMIRKDR